MIASARLHPELYLRDIFRVLPHWPREHYIELASQYWRITRARLVAAQLANELGLLMVPEKPLPTPTYVQRSLHRQVTETNSCGLCECGPRVEEYLIGARPSGGQTWWNRWHWPRRPRADRGVMQSRIVVHSTSRLDRLRLATVATRDHDEHATQPHLSS